MVKYLVCLFVVLMVPLSAGADELMIKIERDKGRWTLSSQGASKEIAKIRTKVDAIRSELANKKYDQERLQKLSTSVDALTSYVDMLSKSMRNRARAEDLKAVREDLGTLVVMIKVAFIYQNIGLTRAFGIIARHLGALEARRTIALDIQAYGGGAYAYEHMTGLSLSLVLPMGLSSWDMKLSAGIGLGASNGVGVLASASVAAHLGKFTLGPAAICMGDVTLGGGSRRFTFGGGAEVSFFATKRLFLSALPFIGVAERRVLGVRQPTLTGGAIGMVGFRLF